jgi:anti-sigma regulatory factor (Ser/Thr protein kinase)
MSHDLAGGRVQHRWVNLRDAEEPLAVTREQVREALEGRTIGSRVDDMAVVAVELVTNALRHTSNGPTGMGMDLYEDTAVLWVHDGDKDVDAVQPRVQPDASSLDLREDGRGLQLVAALVTRWLVWPTSGGKAVVAEISLRQPATAVPGPRTPRL